jgi:hypothetical protein
MTSFPSRITECVGAPAAATVRRASTLGRITPLLVAVVAGCSSSKPAGTGTTQPAISGDAGDLDALVGEVSCTDDPRVDTYTAHLSKMGTGGALSFEIQSSDPAPPAKGGDTFMVKITDATGAAMTGDLTVSLYMPDHGHGTTVDPVITFDPATQTYKLDPLYLFMPGVWRIQLSSYAGSADGGAPVDSVFFYFCIEG